MARQLRIEVTFLESLRQVAGRETTWLELSPSATVADVLALLRERMPGTRPGAGDGLYLLSAG
jgi:hypothetical protein